MKEGLTCLKTCAMIVAVTLVICGKSLAQSSTISHADANHIEGTATDIGSNGIVDIAIRHGTLYWNGSAFQNGYKRIRVPLSSNNNWYYPIISPLPDGNYVITSRAIAVSGAIQNPMTINRLTVDTTLPEVSIDQFSNTVISGNAFDDIGVDRVEIALRTNDSPPEYWNGTAFQALYMRNTTQVTASGEWEFPITTRLPTGGYSVAAFAFDTSGNVLKTTTSSTIETIENDPAPISSISHASASFLSGVARPAASLNRVELAIATATNPPAFWNGDSFSSSYTRVVAKHTGTGNWAYDIVPRLPSGNYSVSTVAFSNEGQSQPVFGTASINVGDCGSGGQDGEGCASLVARSSFTAGEKAEFTIEFQAGESGIPVGGGVSFGFHHALRWPVQNVSPHTAGYVEVDSANQHRISLKRYPNSMIGIFRDNRSGQNSDRIFHNQVVAKIVNTPILPGEIFQLRFGYNAARLQVPQATDADHQIRVTTDIDGDGVYERIDNSPIFELTAATPVRLAAFVPAQAETNKPVRLLLRAEDEFFNIVDDYTGHVEVTDELGNILHPNLLLQNGLTESTVTISVAGPHRLRLRSLDGSLLGRSNPVRVFNTMPVRKLYWADLHGHTGVSDGLGEDANEYFLYGRDKSGLDINALTDHSHNDWPANIQAVKDYYQPGQYVTILAQEASARSNPRDHMNLYYRRDNTAHISTWPHDHADFLDHTYNQYNTVRPEAITGPHHSGYERGAAGNHDYPFRVWDDRVARFVEIYSSHGASEYQGNPRPLLHESTDDLKYVQGALAAGLKFGVIGSTDNHDTKPGRSMSVDYPGGLAGIWATSLTREAVWDAFWNYSTFATSIDRIYLDYSINGDPMGSTIQANTVAINAYIIGKSDNLTVEIVRNNTTIHTRQTNTGVLNIDHDDIPVSGENFYYLRVTQDNGEQAWSTPIWVNN